MVAHNTVRHSGRDLVSVHGLMESLVEHNDLSHAGWLTHDLGITYGHDTDFAGTVIRRNHVHDCVAQGLAEGRAAGAGGYAEVFEYAGGPDCQVVLADPVHKRV